MVESLQICQWPYGKRLWCGETDGLTTLPKRAMCLVEIILTQRHWRRLLCQSVRNTSIVSRQLGKKKVDVGGAMEGEQIRDK